MDKKEFEAKKALIQFEYECKLNLIEEKRKLATLQHDYCMQQIRLKSANIRHREEMRYHRRQQ